MRLCHPRRGFCIRGIKIVIGLVQTVAGGILTAAFKAAGHKGYENYANIHFKHGLTNIAAGFFEAIPLVGLVLLIVRTAKDQSPISYDEDAGAQPRADIGFKFRAYPSLEERDFYFDNCSELAYRVVRAQNLPPLDYPQQVDLGIKG